MDTRISAEYASDPELGRVAGLSRGDLVALGLVFVRDMTREIYQIAWVMYQERAEVHLQMEVAAQVPGRPNRIVVIGGLGFSYLSAFPMVHGDHSVSQ